MYPMYDLLTVSIEDDFDEMVLCLIRDTLKARQWLEQFSESLFKNATMAESQLYIPLLGQGRVHSKSMYGCELLENKGTQEIDERDAAELEAGGAYAWSRY
ncbi:hypothetical protein BDP27DRAFT_1357367 [Rhodocollybia butyracea]|uniref:Uncharacterized protein n=1 Tax=Rhodocollybia butyracea TaxID=206335 RepID=A0A9P5Q941_9AGAR|nr:hypothetical protein BDP27DRAFT_1357367 [Rhodocollybia butyracea]